MSCGEKRDSPLDPVSVSPSKKIKLPVFNDDSSDSDEDSLPCPETPLIEQHSTPQPHALSPCHSSSDVEEKEENPLNLSQEVAKKSPHLADPKIRELIKVLFDRKIIELTAHHTGLPVEAIDGKVRIFVGILLFNNIFRFNFR